MNSIKYLEDIKKDLAQSVNIRMAESSKYKIEVVVGESGFAAGSREVVKKILSDIHELDRSDIVLIQIDDIEYKNEHAVVIVKNSSGEKVVYKNITVENTNTIFENII